MYLRTRSSSESLPSREQQHRGGGELLRHRSGFEDRFRLVRDVVFQIRHPVRASESTLLPPTPTPTAQPGVVELQRANTASTFAGFDRRCSRLAGRETGGHQQRDNRGQDVF